MRRPKSNDSPVTMTISDTQILISKYYFPLKGVRTPVKMSLEHLSSVPESKNAQRMTTHQKATGDSLTNPGKYEHQNTVNP